MYLLEQPVIQFQICLDTNSPYRFVKALNINIFCQNFNMYPNRLNTFADRNIFISLVAKIFLKEKL